MDANGEGEADRVYDLSFCFQFVIDPGPFRYPTGVWLRRGGIQQTLHPIAPHSLGWLVIGASANFKSHEAWGVFFHSQLQDTRFGELIGRWVLEQIRDYILDTNDDSR